jgi:hypothetical protein
VLLVQLVLLVLQDHRELLVLQEQVDQLVLQDPQVLPDHRTIQDQQVRLVLLALPENWEQQVLQVLLDQTVLRVFKEFKGPLVLWQIHLQMFFRLLMQHHQLLKLMERLE